MLHDTVVIEGEVSLVSQIDGDPEVVIAEGGGIVPTGTIEITSNGVYNVTDYASADVDVQGGITPTGTKQININSNGTTTEDVTNYASAEITTNVPASAVDTGTKNISTNGTHDVVGYASANVAVPASEVDSGTKAINSNGTHNVVGYASANVNVPNSYSASDEGKVVSNGALVAQTSDTVTENDTYDTTLINSLTVNVSGGSGTPRLMNHIEFTPVSTFTASNKGTFQLTASSRCVILVDIDEEPSAPDSTEYIALLWSRIIVSYGNQTGSAILRPAGTVGTDSNMGSFNTSTGVVELGGTSGHFMAGTKYHIYQFDLGV